MTDNPDSSSSDTYEEYDHIGNLIEMEQLWESAETELAFWREPIKHPQNIPTMADNSNSSISNKYTEYDEGIDKVIDMEEKWKAAKTELEFAEIAFWQEPITKQTVLISELILYVSESVYDRLDIIGDNYYKLKPLAKYTSQYLTDEDGNSAMDYLDKIENELELGVQNHDDMETYHYNLNLIGKLSNYMCRFDSGVKNKEDMEKKMSETIRKLKFDEEKDKILALNDRISKLESRENDIPISNKIIAKLESLEDRILALTNRIAELDYLEDEVLTLTNRIAELDTENSNRV